MRLAAAWPQRGTSNGGMQDEATAQTGRAHRENVAAAWPERGTSNGGIQDEATAETGRAHRENAGIG